jgi:hypothetical protein
MTTSQTYQTDDDQLVRAHDQAIPEDNPTEAEASLAEPNADLMAPDSDLAEPDADLAEPDADLAEPDADLAEPDADLMTPDSDLATVEPDLAESDADMMTPDSDLADLAEPDADQTAHEDLTSHPAGAAALADSEPATSMVSGYPGFTADGDDAAAEPELADSSTGSPSLVSGAFTVAESVTDSPPAADTASAAGPWNEVQAMFVDDPRASIERAADLVDDRVEELIRSVRERQRSMQSAWQADDAGTEELRVALQHYRSFWTSLDDLPAPA